MRFVNKKNLQKSKKYLFYYLIFFITNLLCLIPFQEIDIKDIKITGTKFISKDLIIKNSSLILPQKLITIKTKYHERELRENLSLKNISLKRQIIPFGLRIFIQTRTPVAYAEIHNNKKVTRGFVDEEGFFINKEFAIIKEKLPSEFKVIGWGKISHDTTSKVIKAYKGNNDLTGIYISQEGFLVLEEKRLKKIFLGNQPDKIDLQLKLIFEIREQLKDKGFFEKIENLDLTDLNNPTLKVFKP